MPNESNSLRWLIKDVTLAKRGDLIVIDIRWQTEARTSLSIPRLKKSWEASPNPIRGHCMYPGMGTNPFGRIHRQLAE